MWLSMRRRKDKARTGAGSTSYLLLDDILKLHRLNHKDDRIRIKVDEVYGV